MTLIQEMQKHASNENIYYIEEVADIILDENIFSIEDLEEYEKRYNKNKSFEESISMWTSIVDKYPYEFDGLLNLEMKKLDDERKLIDQGNIEDRILHLVKYYYLTKRDNPYPYQTYKFIIQDKL